ncbi:MAG: imidazole glycerol phosphate synthase subunit HisH [Rhodobiaceae bacterium]|jgi:glutamine amidotransferase|nr:imidazole glycerol phosphate synthase subunit HisH [Pseudomonadota bacterium]MEC7645589.1 imidazole glycerol phosphate synthase subunit HisH [Pseudomonadota bacterium]MEC8365921.1 imidazole glycerol phosphate synthase subunit HisH [Pseudomonadota bacterium]HAG23276.1 imidazole glycerol phosphate synthase subunit HisH [Alphaproteobacteria bacterium]|tara:strand:- start:73 stop:684 length:612 start_codon:yes stop_codon:yes gene_type:complete
MIAIIDSGGANIASVRFALERLGVDSVLTADPAVISAAERVILPGVGAAPVAMAQLARAGLVECIRGLTQPVLGICLGMQLLFERSEEGDTPLLGLVGGTCGAFDPGMGLTVPHMGWNRLLPRGEGRHPLLSGVEDGAHVYFVHSYAAPVSADTVASCSYGVDFTALVARGNFMGAQFHPERSGPVGARILGNFLALPAGGKG